MRILSIACILAAIAWYAAGRFGAAPAPAPPVLPGRMDRLDTEVAALIRRAADEVARDPRDAGGWMTLGMVYEANGLFRYAVATYEQAGALRDDDPRAWYRLGAAHERVGDLPPAIDAMSRAATLDGSIADVQWQLGVWLLDAGRLEEAESHLRRAAGLAPDDERPWFGLARLAIAQRDPAAAIEAIETHGLTGGANAAYAWRLLGQAHQLRGEPDRAAAALARGGSGAPTFLTVRVEELMPYRVGVAAVRQDIQLLLRQGRRAEARRRLEGLRRLDPDDTGAIVMLAQLDLGERQADQAVARLETALGLDEDDFDVNLNMVNTLLARGRPGDVERALLHADRAIAMRPLDAQARRLKGRALARADRGDEAVVMLKEAHRRNASDPGLLALAGAIEVELGRWTDAIATLTAVLEKDPGDAHALLGLARAHVELGRTDEARAALGRIAPDAPVDRRIVEALRLRIGGG